MKMNKQALGFPTLENEIWLHTQMRREGHEFVLTGWLVVGAKTKLFELRVDIRPIAKYIARYHHGLHAQLRESRVSGTTVGKRGLFKKLGRTIKKVAKSKLVRRARKVLKTVGPLAIPAAGLALAAATKSPALAKLAKGSMSKLSQGAGPLARVMKFQPKTLTSMVAASKSLGFLGRSRLRAKGRLSARGGLRFSASTSASTSQSTPPTRFSKFIAKMKKRTNRRLLLKARRKRMFVRHSNKNVKLAINKATTKIVNTKAKKIIRKAPHLARQAISSTGRSRKQTTPKSQMIHEVIQRSNHNPKAFKARQVLSRMALHGERLEQLDKRTPARGVTGLVVDDQGKIKHGRFKVLSTGTGPVDVILRKSGKVRKGHFQRISGDCVGCGPVAGDPEPGFLVAGEPCVGADCVGSEPAPGFLVAGCVGCGPAYPMGPVLVK
jgi:hypothetical protein